MTYDSERKRIVMVGGTSVTTGSVVPGGGSRLCGPVRLL
jgi:hypothetical protein